MNLSGNTILITGGSSGIGLALAKRFIDLGNQVIISGRSEEKLNQIKNELPGISTFCGDLSEQENLLQLQKFIHEEFPQLNMLINNAGIQYNYHLSAESDVLSKIDYELACNLNAPIKLTALLLPTLEKQDLSAIVNVSSALFMAPKKSAPVYCASKAALHNFTQSLRYQLEESKIEVYEIIPALIDTAMTAGRGKSKLSPDQLVDEFLDNFKAGRKESYIGKTKLLRILKRIAPRKAQSLLKEA
ncbi:SDR family oxidoreductase [Croceimicrobium hydrocarbonivorans]|uniref:SDR family oxidoreductase n=1 Tax=Croceimicrobium hydrocarbonivorans TaxID=2761580 RepID=A0A7H0VHK0_9FLAO|nr:SDR family oxidoreductase [Croceimicrobium hydrocarbonivorans]QNR25198.1 SDR family oxidoreductase [Croceimicrobium hydrocarbonivorans]